MANTFNQVTLMGYLGKDPVFTRFENGSRMVKFRMATQRYQGEDRNSVPDWHSVVCWNGIADSVSQFMRKGSRIHVVGPMLQNRWEDADGRYRSRIEIKGENVIFLDNPNASPPAEDTSSAEAQYVSSYVLSTDEEFEEMDSENLNREFKDVLESSPSGVA